MDNKLIEHAHKLIKRCLALKLDFDECLNHINKLSIIAKQQGNLSAARSLSTLQLEFAKQGSSIEI